MTLGSGSESPTVDTALIRLEGIHKSFGGVRALDRAELSVRSGEIHTLLGENGAGKSTLVKIIAGALKPDAGTLTWDGVRIPAFDVHAAGAMGISVIHQRLNTVSHLSVEDNITLGAEVTRFGFVNRVSQRRTALSALERLGIALRPDRQASALSVAERQLVEIARALQRNVRLLVMDEPTASLGEREADRLFEVIRGLRDRGVAVIFISHKLAEVLAISDRVTVLRNGNTIGTVDASGASPGSLVEMMVGRQLSSPTAAGAKVGSDEIILNAHELVTDGGLQGVSLALRRGEILGVYGLMGSGRTELVRALFGADRILSGELKLHDHPINPSSPAAAKDLGFGFVPEERRQGIFEGISIRENITSASGDLITKAGFIRHRKERTLASRIAKSLDVRAPTIETAVHALSGGNQQKVVLGKWLVRNAEILLLDDPTSGVDVGAKAEFYRLIRKQTEMGTSIIMTSSELPELLSIADRILVLKDRRAAGVVEGAAMTEQNVLHLALRGSFHEQDPSPLPTHTAP